LCECLDAYLPQSDEQRQAYKSALLSDPDPRVKAMTMTMFEQFRQQGREEGRAEAQRQTLEMLLETRFGLLPPSVKERITALSPEKVEKALRAIVKAQSLQDLGLEP
jgi:hypothetical protein